jgi:hypothetical protein
VGPQAYRTVLPIEECVGRLQTATDPWPSFLHLRWADGKFLLRLDSPTFRISRPDAYRNGFASHFYGKLERVDETTVIRGEVRLSTGSVLFFSGVLAFMIAVLAPFGGQFEATVLVLWVGIALCLWRFGGRLGPGTSAQYGQFIQQVLAADPVRG